MINFWKKRYEQETPIPAKFLLPDGTITDTLPGGGGGSMDNYYNKREVNDLLDEVANNASQEIANQINDTSSDRNHTLSSAEVDGRISSSITDTVESGNEKAVTSNAVNGALTNFDKIITETDANNCLGDETKEVRYFLNTNASNIPTSLPTSNILIDVNHIKLPSDNRNIFQTLYIWNVNKIQKMYTRTILRSGTTYTYSDWEKLVTEKVNIYVYIGANVANVIDISTLPKGAYRLSVTGDYSVGSYYGILFVGTEKKVVQLQATNMTVSISGNNVEVVNAGNAQNFTIQIM